MEASDSGTTGAKRTFGFTRAEALGRSLDITISEKLCTRHWSGYEQTMQIGRRRYGAGNLVSVLRSARRLSGVASIMRDVTAKFEERKTLKCQIEACREQG